MKRWIQILVVLGVLIPADASVVLDQEQATVNLGSTGEGFLVGGDQQYVLAQTVTAGLDGRLVRVEIPAVCQSGTLTVEIRDLVPGEVPGTLVPGTAVRGTGSAAASAFPPTAGFAFGPIDLEHAIPMRAGERFAVVLRNDTGRCGAGMGLSTDLYSGGESWWRYSGTAPDVWLSTGGFSDPVDAAFRTYVETGPDREAGFVPCSVSGFGPVPIPHFVPLCRCLSDSTLRETRCGFFHPAMFLVRRVPLPIPAGKPFTVQWTLFPLKGFDSVKVNDVLPKGFGASSETLLFYGSQIPAGGTLTLSYETVAPGKAGNYGVMSNISIATDKADAVEGTIRTKVEVRR